MRTKKCKACKTPFTPTRPLQVVCSPKCAGAYAREQEKKKRRKETQEMKKGLLTRSERIKLLQVIFNKWIRERDKDLPCISCGRSNNVKWNAGHYRSVGSCPELRFEPLNVHKQCEHCNSYLSGNLIEYRKGLINRIGLEKVEWLEGNHPPKKYTADEIDQLMKVYRMK